MTWTGMTTADKVYRLVAQENEYAGKWVSRDGQLHDIEEMGSRHLRNLLGHLERNLSGICRVARLSVGWYDLDEGMSESTAEQVSHYARTTEKRLLGWSKDVTSAPVFEAVLREVNRRGE